MIRTVIIVMVVLLVIITGAAPALAHGRVGIHSSIWIGPGWWGPWWGAPVYPYPYPYPYTYYYPTPRIIERQPQVYEGTLQEDQPYYWYFCPGSETYYPYVKQCPEGWMKVVPPASPSQGKE